MISLLLSFTLLAGPAPVDRMYVFGDSYSDSGAGYVDGDGPTAVVYLAERLGFPLVPATAQDAAGKSLNFAVSGAQSGSGAGRKVKDAMLGRGMRNQVDDFVARVKSGSVKFRPETTLFFIAGGLNDRRLPTETTVENLKGEIRSLYEVGARRFAVALLPVAIPSFSEVGLRLNPALGAIPAAMATELKGTEFRVSKWGSYMDEVMRDPAKFGIANTRDHCAGRAIFDENTTPCASPASYFFYHAGHPSTAVHKIVGAKLYEELSRPSAGR